MTEPIKVGLIGCGAICGIYLENGRIFEDIEIVACADLQIERAQAKAEEYGIPKACSGEELLADPSIAVVLNLTTPIAHYPIALAALEAGKSVYNEKPLAITRDEGAQLLALAKQSNLRIGCAPDTFLGAGIQTCRKLIDDGWIGEPIAANAFLGRREQDSKAITPEHHYKVGGGPMFNMGPYYLTALVSLIGPIARVSGMARKTFPERLVNSHSGSGTRITVDIPTHIIGTLEFVNGALGTITTSFDLWKSTSPPIEIHGTEGSLSVTNPNLFGGSPKFLKGGTKEWQPVSLTHGYAENSRGIGLADMACAMRKGRDHRASGELAYHVLDVMHAIHEAAQAGTRVDMQSTCLRPAPMPTGLPAGSVDGGS